MSSNADIVIGAQDKASDVLKKIDVNMAGIGMHAAKASIGFGAAAAGGAVFGAAVIAVGVAFKGLQAAMGTLQDATVDFDKATEAVRSLDQALELNGGSSSKLTESYRELADSLEAVTNVEAETTMGLMKSAALLGINNDKVDELAAASIGLSEALGVPMETAMDKARLAMEGNFKAFEKMLPAMKEMSTDEEKLAAVSQLAAKGLAMKTAAAGSAAEAAKRAENAFGNMMESVGGLLSPLRQLAFDGFTAISNAISVSLGNSLEFGAHMMQVFANGAKQGIQMAGHAIIAGLTAAEVGFMNFGTVVELAISTAQLSFEQIKNSVSHTMTVAIPQYVTWFATNFNNIIADAMTLAQRSMMAFATRAHGIWEGLLRFINTGDARQFGINMAKAATDIVANFEAKTQPLPEIAARKLSDKEQELTAKVSALGGSLANQFNEKLTERVSAFDSAFEGKEINVDLKPNTAELNAAMSKPTELKVVESRLLTRGKQEDSMQKMVKIGEDQRKALQTIEQNTRQKNAPEGEKLNLVVLK